METSMAKPIKFDESGDSQDLQALFDTIAAGPEFVAPVAEPNPSGDSDDLQSLFDSVADQVGESAEATEPSRAPNVVNSEGAATSEGTAAQDVMFNRLGHMARNLHNSLRELGYDRSLEDTARMIPDARERLTYIAQMTEQAASRVLNATDIAMPAQNELEQRTKALGARWDKMFANQLSVDEFKALAADTRTFLADAPTKIDITNAQLTEIMMAQDFQDLTGQVIKKVVEVVQNFETQLLQILVEVMPEEKKVAAPIDLMNGPVINAAGRVDVVTTQTQVDDLLESLGF
jgi:chemotaxis protein CheZ